MQFPFKRFVVFSLILTLFACTESHKANNLRSSAVVNNDLDGDGISDRDDQWPTDPFLPVISKLWGIQGELWRPDSRLPFVALAGYDEGATIPNHTRIVANVLTDFGASSKEGSANDTLAFQKALAYASTQVSADNPGVVYIPEGVYDLDEQLHINVSGLVLRGAGRDKSILRFSTGLINDTSALGDEFSATLGIW